MCQSKSGCTQPENLKGDPEDCSAEQIAICHPGEERHPCEPEESEKKWKLFNIGGGDYVNRDES